MYIHIEFIQQSYTDIMSADQRINLPRKFLLLPVMRNWCIALREIMVDFKLAEYNLLKKRT